MTSSSPNVAQMDLQALFPAGVAAHLSTNPLDLAELHLEEAAGTTRFAAARLAEFRRGRHCVRQALRPFGPASDAVPIGPSREPLWPTGFVGSISHTRNAAAAVVGEAGRFQSLGIDLEETEALEAALQARICRPEEMPRLAILGIEPGVAARVFFSAKEAAYKALWPLTRQFLDFHDLSIEPLPATQAFRVAAHASHSPAELCAAIEGRYEITAGLIATAATIARV